MFIYSYVPLKCSIISLFLSLNLTLLFFLFRSKPLKTVSTSQVQSNNHKCGNSFTDEEKISLFDSSDKENNHISRLSDDFEDFDIHNLSERKLKRKRKPLFSNCTLLSEQNQSLSVNENAEVTKSSKDSKVDCLENKQCTFDSTFNLKSEKVASVIDRCHSSYMTSTPVFDVDNCPAIESTQKSYSQDSILMNGKVVLEPLRITPIQWKKLTLSCTTENPINGHNSIQSLCGEHRNPEVLKTSGAGTSQTSSVELKECVVSLEKLKITPLKNRSKYLMAGLSGDGSYVSNRGKSQLSFLVSHIVLARDYQLKQIIVH